MPREPLDAALKHVLADLDEAFVRLALDTQNDERGIDCLSFARHNLQEVITKLEEETQMRPLVP